MSKKDFLLEIGLEEIPARFVTEASKQLTEKMKNWFAAQKISFTQITPYATPRRLAVLIEDVAEKQLDVKEEAKGPARKIAVDDQGNWSKAAQGFVKSQGMSTDDLYFKELKGIEYVYLTKEIKGIETEHLLPQLREIITGLNFPKNMRWGIHEQRFVRPLRWMVALYGKEVIPFEITAIHTGNETVGHRFLGEKITIANPKEYEKLLLGQYVIASSEERKSAVLAQINMLAEEKGWSVPIDVDLLEEVIHLVEYPTALSGTFDEEFLHLPQEVLITSMKEHQRYFPVRDASGELLPHFITIRNGGVDSEGIVVRGNEKVLRARLADARFFYEEDKKLQIDSALAQLGNVVFHEELGSIGDKIRRIREMANQLSVLVNVSPEMVQSIDRTAEICKFDLVSQMVNEFTELQGRMGEEYARLAGESEEVSKGIFEHYLPRFAGDQLPSTELGAIVAVADKLDSIVGCFGIGIVPTGSQDPYGLRRQAAGIVQILLAQSWSISVDELFDIALLVYNKRQLMKRDWNDVKADLKNFFQLRIKNRMQEQEIRYDVIEAVLAQEDSNQLVTLFSKADVLMNQVSVPTFKNSVETFSRVSNLAQKVDKTATTTVQEDVLEEKVEVDLHNKYLEVEGIFEQYAKEQDWKKAYDALTTLKDPIDDFFDQVMVMVEDDKIRMNRLALLQQISLLIQRFADFSKIVFS